MMIFSYIVFSILTGVVSITPTFHYSSDTIQVESIGLNNEIAVDSIMIGKGAYNCDSISVSGKITQTGNNNQVDIKTKQEQTHPNNKQQIKIMQTGNNNKVKINSK